MIEDKEWIDMVDRGEISSTELVARILDNAIDPADCDVDVDQLARRIVNALNY